VHGSHLITIIILRDAEERVAKDNAIRNIEASSEKNLAEEKKKKQQQKTLTHQLTTQTKQTNPMFLTVAYKPVQEYNSSAMSETLFRISKVLLPLFAFSSIDQLATS
jgi:hypothetical protein